MREFSPYSGRESSALKDYKSINLNMAKKTKEDVWTTYDLGVSAALLTYGYKLISVDKTDPKKALFVFLKDKNIDDTANAYFADKLELNARYYFDHLKALKNRLYSRQ